MATFSSVTRQHVLRALDEHDARGSEQFLAVYGFEPIAACTIVHESRSYDARAVLALAHRFATGRLATPEEFHGMDEAAAILRKRGFEVSTPAPARRSSPRASTMTSARRTSAARAAREERPALCPTCSMALPGTGICDYCA